MRTQLLPAVSALSWRCLFCIIYFLVVVPLFWNFVWFPETGFSSPPHMGVASFPCASSGGCT